MIRGIVLICCAVLTAPASATDRELIREGRKITKACQACHDLRSDRVKFGPPLRNLENRPIASVEGYPYSEAFKSLEGAWDRETLKRFLRAPAVFAPGNKMKFPGFKTDREAEAAAAYIFRRTSR